MQPHFTRVNLALRNAIHLSIRERKSGRGIAGISSNRYSVFFLLTKPRFAERDEFYGVLSSSKITSEPCKIKFISTVSLDLSPCDVSVASFFFWCNNSVYKFYA